jgi:TRAP-type C4-dicarboxylate transport system permease small subunit
MRKRLCRRLENIADLINSVISKFVLFLLLGMLVVINLQIISREFFTAFSWTEELSRYLLVWSSFFATTIAYKKGAHIAITFVVKLFRKKQREIVKLIMDLFSAVFFIIVIYYGFKMISMQIYQKSPAMQIPMRLVYLCIPLSGIIMLYYVLIEILRFNFGEEESK